MVTRKELPEGKLALFWIAGAVLMLAGAWIAGHLEMAVGVTPGAYYGTLALALVLILVAGLAWIAVAIAVAQHRY